MLIVYGGSLSPYVMRVMQQVRAKRLPHERKPAPGGDSKSPEYLALNPMGRYPTVRHGELVLPESAVIAEYLEDAFPAPPMLPADARERARARLIVRIVDLYLARSIHPLYRETQAARRNEAAIASLLGELDQATGYLDAYVAPGQYAVGGAQSLADFALLPYLFVFKAVLPVLGRPAVPEPVNLRAWWLANEKSQHGQALVSEMTEALNAVHARRTGPL